MAFPPTSLALPIPPSFSSLATSGIWHSSPSYSRNGPPAYAGNGSSAYAGNGSSAYAGNGSPANFSNSSLRTSDMSPLNQPHANITRTESPSSERNRPPPNISNLAWCCDQPQAKRLRVEYQSSQSSFNTSSDTSAIQSKPLDLSKKKCDEGVKMTKKRTSLSSSQKKTTKKTLKSGAISETICSSAYARSDVESKQLPASLDLGRIKKFKETQFEYSDGVIAAKSLGPWIRQSKFFKQEHEHEQKSIIVLPKGETLPDDLKELKQLVRSAETDFDVALLCPRNVTQCRHYKFIFSEGFELHVAENSKSEEFHYFGRFRSDPTVFYELNEPPLSNDIRNILTEERVWVNKRTKVFGKTITVKQRSSTHSWYANSPVLNFPRIWYPKGHVILYGTVPQNLDDWDEINTFRQWIGDTNNLPTVTKENVTEEANRKLGCVHCLKYTVTRDGEWFELYAVQFGKACTHRYLRKKDKPHVFLILKSNYSMDVENRLLSIAKNIPVSVQTGKFFLAGSPAATFVSTQRASQLGKMTEKKTRESNYQGLVLASMVSCLVFVSTYWALGKKE